MSDTNEADNTSRASTTAVTAVAAAHVATDKSVSPTTVEPGDEVVYTVTARNRGPAVAQQVGAVDDLPDVMRFVGSDDECVAEGQRVTCRSEVALAVGDTHDFRLRAVLDPEYGGDGSDVVNVATATSPTDPDGGDPSTEVAIVVEQDDQGPAPTPSTSPSPGPEGAEASVPDAPAVTTERATGVPAAPSPTRSRRPHGAPSPTPASRTSGCSPRSPRWSSRPPRRAGGSLVGVDGGRS